MSHSYFRQRNVTLVACCVLLAACTPWRKTYLEHGVAHLTQDSVAARLGPPQSERVLSDSQVVWHYQYTRSHVSGNSYAVSGGSKCREYILLFDRHKILQHVTYQKC